MADGRGFEPRVPFGTHAFQACTIDRSVTHPKDRRSKLQSSEQFVERQLNADVKFAKVCVLRADWIETHLIDDRLDLKCIAREQSHAPFRVIETGRACNELFYFAGKFTADCGMSFHQFAALVIRKRIPIALLTATFTHIIKTSHRPI